MIVFSYLAKFLGSLDSQYASLFGSIESPNDITGKNKIIFNGKVLIYCLDVKEFSQKITRYLKTSQRTLPLPVGEVMLNRKGRL